MRAHGRRPVRIMHFADVINRYDFIDNVVRHVDHEKFTTCAATYVSEANIEPPDFAADGIDHYVLGVRSRRDYPAAAARLAGLLRRQRIDILHSHHFDPGAIAWAATRLHRGTRLVVGRHYSDDHHAYLRGVKRRSILASEAVVHRGAARIVVPSTMIRDLLVGSQRVPAAKVAVISYAFDHDRYRMPSAEARAAVRRELGIEDRFAIATVGRIIPKKGHRFLVQALAGLNGRLSDLVWLIVGDGPTRAELEREVAAAGLTDRVRFLGWRPGALEITAAVDAVVQPTLQEAYSQVMAEALWLGTPLIMSDVSGATDLIADGKTGLLVRRGEPDGLAQAIRRLHDDPALRERLAAGGRAHVTAELGLERVIPRYEAVYDAVARDQ